ncbi:MAG: hypothetical protein ACRCW9_06265 [Cetobacterium sp.]
MIFKKKKYFIRVQFIFENGTNVEIADFYTLGNKKELDITQIQKDFKECFKDDYEQEIKKVFIKNINLV